MSNKECVNSCEDCNGAKGGWQNEEYSPHWVDCHCTKKFTAFLVITDLPKGMSDDEWDGDEYGIHGQGSTPEEAFQLAFSSAMGEGYGVSSAGATMHQTYMDQFDGASGVANVSVTFGPHGYEDLHVGEYEETVDGSCSDVNENFSNGYQ